MFGGDYPTKDGTGVRDYIHVMDLAEGHLMAMAHLGNIEGFKAYNLGAGVGYSVLEMVQAFEKPLASPFLTNFTASRWRPSAFWADARLAKQELGWEVQRGIDAMMRDTWNWQQKNPQGYR